MQCNTLIAKVKLARYKLFCTSTDSISVGFYPQRESFFFFLVLYTKQSKVISFIFEHGYSIRIKKTKPMQVHSPYMECVGECVSVIRTFLLSNKYAAGNARVHNASINANVMIMSWHWARVLVRPLFYSYQIAIVIQN